MTASRTLVDWAWTLDARDAPASARRAATRHLLDGLGTLVAAARLGAAPAALRVACELGGPPETTVPGLPERIGAPAGALALGTLLHALDYDDTHASGLVHATAGVLPALLAVGEQTGADGPALLAAALAGYEVVTRLGAATPHGFHARGFHATAVCGVFSSALVAARLAGLDRRQAVAALGIAGSQAAGSLEFLHSGGSTKQLHPGLAAQAGVFAARLAAAGADGPEAILEGDAGLYRLYADRDVAADAVTAGLGKRWEVERITVKPYPACQLSHASLDALASLALPSPSEIDELIVTLPRESMPIVAEPEAAKVAPRTPYEAKFSVQWCAAVLVLDGRLDVASFAVAAPDRLDRDDARDLAERVRVVASDPGVAAADAPGHVEVRLRDGTTLVGAVDRSRGGPGAPLSDDELLVKFHANCGGPGPTSRRLASMVQDLERTDAAQLAAAVAEQVEVG